MEILKSEQYISEKLSIQPVTSDRLYREVAFRKIEDKEGWKSMVRTGDIFSMSKTSNSRKMEYLFVYISHDDIMRYKYNDIVRIGHITENSFMEGVFVSCKYKSGSDMGSGYTSMDIFRDDRMQSTGGALFVDGIYRYEKLPSQPFDIDFFNNVDASLLVPLFERV